MCRVASPRPLAALNLSSALRAHVHPYDRRNYAQPIETARRPNCYVEEDPFTRRIIDHHPSSGAVGAMRAAQAGMHLLVTHWRDREGDATDATWWRVARWDGVTLGDALRNVVHSEQIGLRPFGSSTAGSRR
jgi:hypothetical protein